MLKTIPEACKNYASYELARRAISKRLPNSELATMIVAQPVNDIVRFFPVILPKEEQVQAAIFTVHDKVGFYCFRP